MTDQDESIERLHRKLDNLLAMLHPANRAAEELAGRKAKFLGMVMRLHMLAREMQNADLLRLFAYSPEQLGAKWDEMVVGGGQPVSYNELRFFAESLHTAATLADEIAALVVGIRETK